MATIPLQEPAYRGNAGPLFFAAGFRPFFLFAAMQAAVSLPIWLAVYAGGIDLRLPFAPTLWHGHEMVFGFAGAAIAGFLLTAVPNWTNSPPVSGRPLMVLFVLWLAGRIAFFLAGWLPAPVVAAADLGFVPYLAWLVGRPLVAVGKMRNIVFLPILALFLLANLAVHVQAALGAGDVMAGVYLGLTVVLALIVIVGGRIIPSFTQNWLRMAGRPVDIKAVGWIEKGGALASMILGMVLAVFWPGSAVTGVVLLAAAAIHGLRLCRWHGHSTLANPILWVLHLGYLWLVLGLGLLGLSSFVAGLPASAALHALTAGCVGTMVLAVMSRAALGHSGRPLVVARAVSWAYAALSAGSLLRVIAPWFDEGQMALTHAGGSLWALAWGVFVVVYWPVLTKPRVDGRPG